MDPKDGETSRLVSGRGRSPAAALLVGSAKIAVGKSPYHQLCEKCMGIDEAILEAAGDRWTKVVMVIGKAATAIDGHLPDDERAEVFAQRIEALVVDGRLTAQGNLRNWRHSEVRCVR